MSRTRIIVGIILIVFAATVCIAFFFLLDRESGFIDGAKRFTGAVTGDVKIGENVVIEGTVSEKNGILVHDFVDASKEYYSSSKNSSGWKNLQDYHQRIIADLEKGTVALESDHVCTRAKGNNILDAGEKTEGGRETRYIGIRRKDPITATGTLASADPAIIKVRYWYSGTIADYRADLADGRRNTAMICAGIALVGIALIAWGRRSK